jgi:hypothetical protein
MPKQSENAYSDQRRQQHPSTPNPNPPTNSVSQALRQSQQQFDRSKRK